MVSGRKGLGEGGLLFNGDRRKGGGFGDQCIVFDFSLFTDGEFAKVGLPGMEGDSRREETVFASQVWWVQG